MRYWSGLVRQGSTGVIGAFEVRAFNEGDVSRRLLSLAASKWGEEGLTVLTTEPGTVNRLTKRLRKAGASSPTTRAV